MPKFAALINYLSTQERKTKFDKLITDLIKLKKTGKIPSIKNIIEKELEIKTDPAKEIPIDELKPSQKEVYQLEKRGI